MIGKLPLLLSVELLVLIAGIFLLVYIAKQQVSKWYTYGTSLIVIFTVGMMICSVCCAVCMRHCGPQGMREECRMDEKCGPGGMMHPGMRGECNHEMMREGKCEKEMMEGDECEKGMMGKGGCEKDMKECEMKAGGGDMPCCKKGMHEGKCDKMGGGAEKDSIIKKEIIIRKK